MKLAINLLPFEYREEENKRSKFYKVQAISIGFMFVMFFLASLTVGLRVLQSQNISQIKKKVDESQQRVSEYKTTQASLFILKNRLNSIDEYLENTSNQTKLYKIVSTIIPANVSVSLLSIDRNEDVMLVATTSDSSAIDGLINALNSKEKNEGVISQVAVENISRGKDGIYRLSLKIKSKFK